MEFKEEMGAFERAGDFFNLGAKDPRYGFYIDSIDRFKADVLIAANKYDLFNTSVDDLQKMFTYLQKDKIPFLKRLNPGGFLLGYKMSFQNDKERHLYFKKLLPRLKKNQDLGLSDYDVVRYLRFWDNLKK